MKKKIRNMIVSILILVCLGLAIGIYIDLEIERTKTHSRNFVETFYSFNPFTIMDNLNEENSFTIISEPDYINETNSLVVNWDIKEYLQIAQAIILKSKGTTDANIVLYSIDLGLPCNDILNGPQQASFRFTKMNDSRITNYFDTYQPDWIIGIIPNEKYIYMYSTEKKQTWSDVSEINTDNIPMIEEILNTAEEHGGKTFRQTIKNKCDISIISGQNFTDTWRVRYSNLDQSNAFSIIIDPIQNKYEVVTKIN